VNRIPAPDRGFHFHFHFPDPVDIQRTFVRGHLYVPLRILEDRGKEGAYYRTVALRSDGAVLGWGYLPAPSGTPLEDRVLALDDGTIIRRPPKAAAGTSWSTEAINRFLGARARGFAHCYSFWYHPYQR
jgi:hypothetical protein